MRPIHSRAAPVPAPPRTRCIHPIHSVNPRSNMAPGARHDRSPVLATNRRSCHERDPHAPAPSRRQSRPRRARSRRPSVRCRGVEASAAGNSGRRCLTHGAGQSPARRSRRASHFRRRPGRLREDDPARAVGCSRRETIRLDHARPARQRPDRAAAAPRRCDRRAGADRRPGAQRARRLEAVLLEHRGAARHVRTRCRGDGACSSSKTLTCSASRTRSRSCRCSPSTSPRARQSSSRAGSSARSPHGCGCAAACSSSGRPISR